MRTFDLRLFFSLLAVMLCVTVFSMTAFAVEGDNPPGVILPETTVSTELPDEETNSEEPADADEDTGEFSLEELFGGLLSAFTPEGNLSLIDDFQFTGVDGNGDAIGKQFITVQSKSGNYFFIIIDRAADSENVYFLNLVDEADLLALMDEAEAEPGPAPAICSCKDKCYAGHVDTACPVCAANMSECTGKEIRPEPTATPEVTEPEPAVKNSAVNPVLPVILLLGLGGGAAFYFLKVRGKGKPKAKGSAAEDEDGEYEFETYDLEDEDEHAEDSEADDN